MTSTEPTDEQWQTVRELLKQGLLAAEIPLDGKEMRPKAVWQKCKTSGNQDIECVDYDTVPVRNKFIRMLRSLRKKHGDGDLEHEGKKAIVWGKSAAKQYLRKCFRDKVIPADYQDAKEVWTNHCAGHVEFERMVCDAAFARRLGTVRDDYLKKRDRCEKDLAAYLVAKRNHPTPVLNSRGEPQWNGSDAQKLLKQAIEKEEHAGLTPAALWESKAEYKVYSLQTFRDHIYQEERLVKFHNYLRLLKKRKQDALQY